MHHIPSCPPRAAARRAGRLGRAPRPERAEPPRRLNPAGVPPDFALLSLLAHQADPDVIAEALHVSGTTALRLMRLALHWADEPPDDLAASTVQRAARRLLGRAGLEPATPTALRDWLATRRREERPREHDQRLDVHRT